MVVISRTKETYILEGFFFRDRVEMKNILCLKKSYVQYITFLILRKSLKNLNSTFIGRELLQLSLRNSR